jgi:hypothetical protein
MSSFINMLANDIWSEQDITNRTEAMVRAVMPLQDELVLNRKVQGAALGQYELTAQDQTDMGRLAQAGFSAQQEGIAARADMTLLLHVFEVEAAITRLDRPEVAPEDETYEADQAERTEAMGVVSGASEEVLIWVEARRPPVESIQDAE